MKDQRSNITRILVTVAALGLVGAETHAQVGGVKSGANPAAKRAAPASKVPESKGGALDPEKTLKKSRLDRYEITDTTGPRVAVVRAGSVVEGKTAAGDVQRIRFEGVRGAKVDLTLVAVDRGLTGTGILRGPHSIELAKLVEDKKTPGTYVLEDFELKTSGIFTVEVVLGALGEFRLETAMKIAKPEVDLREWKDGRPQRILLGGMTDRALTDLTVRAKDRSLNQTFNARLYDPDGLPVDLSPYLTLSGGGSTLTLRRLPLSIPGDYELFIADTSRATGDAVITSRYDDPSEGKDRVRL